MPHVWCSPQSVTRFDHHYHQQEDQAAMHATSWDGQMRTLSLMQTFLPSPSSFPLSCPQHKWSLSLRKLQICARETEAVWEMDCSKSGALSSTQKSRESFHRELVISLTYLWSIHNFIENHFSEGVAQVEKHSNGWAPPGLDNVLYVFTGKKESSRASEPDINVVVHNMPSDWGKT